MEAIPQRFSAKLHMKLIKDLRSSVEKVSCKMKFEFQKKQVSKFVFFFFFQGEGWKQNKNLEM